MDQFVCACGYEEHFKYEEFISGHMQVCGDFQAQSPLCKMLRQIQALTIPQILTLKLDLQCQTQRVEKELRQRNYKTDLTDNDLQRFIQEEQPFTQFDQHSQKLPCESCRKLFKAEQDFDRIWYLESCCHLICKPCLSAMILKDFVPNDGKILCCEPSCGSRLTQSDIIESVGREKFQDLDQKLALKNQNIVSCVKCQQQYSFEEGKHSEIIKDSQGKQLVGYVQCIELVSDHLKVYIQNRFVCPNDKCKTEQCRNCLVTPFHIGTTCAENKTKQSAVKCRLCESVVAVPDRRKPKHLQDICETTECQLRSQLLCSQTLQCGHFCQGFKSEKQCLPCLNEECIKLNPNVNQNLDDYCNVCFTEGLKAAPCVRAKCGHIYHYECVLKRLETRWNGPRIIFNYLNCPLCKQEMDFGTDFPAITAILETSAKLRGLVIQNATERLEMEGRDKDKEIHDPKHPYFKKPVEYAMAIFCFYECYKCKKPYFGGLKSCQNNLEDDRRQFNKEDLICPDCCPISFENKCKKHGAKYIEFKCRFCCSPAVWFCFGTTHFCDPCHMQAGNCKPKECKGPEYCPLKIKHAPNGEECALGCAVCRQRRMDNK